MAGMVKRIGGDRFRLRLSAEEMGLLRSLPDQLRSVLGGARPRPQEPSGLFGDAAGVPEEPTRADDLSGTGARPADELPDSPRTGRRAPEADPVLERLFPRAYLEPEDVERDAEYHRLVREDLLEAKLANLDVVTSTLDRGTLSLRRWTIELSEDEAGAWLGALNDLRLALGVRLGITEDFEGDIDPSDPQAPALNVLSYLGWLEENLVDALSTA
jgi:hypothetical protein